MRLILAVSRAALYPMLAALCVLAGCSRAHEDMVDVRIVNHTPTALWFEMTTDAYSLPMPTLLAPHGESVIFSAIPRLPRRIDARIGAFVEGKEAMTDTTLVVGYGNPSVMAGMPRAISFAIEADGMLVVSAMNMQ